MPVGPVPVHVTARNIKLSLVCFLAQAAAQTPPLHPAAIGARLTDGRRHQRVVVVAVCATAAAAHAPSQRGTPRVVAAVDFARLRVRIHIEIILLLDLLQAPSQRGTPRVVAAVVVLARLRVRIRVGTVPLLDLLRAPIDAQPVGRDPARPVLHAPPVALPSPSPRPPRVLRLPAPPWSAMSLLPPSQQVRQRVPDFFDSAVLLAAAFSFTSFIFDVVVDALEEVERALPPRVLRYEH